APADDPPPRLLTGRPRGRSITPGGIPPDEATSCVAMGTQTMAKPLGEFGRFAEQSLYILVSLSDGPRHGYAIMTDVERISGAPLGPGTLYGALARLERRGLIEALAPEERRRPYRITGQGT